MHIYNVLGLLGLATATNVLVPLYVYPGNGAPTNWQPLINTIATYPSLNFTVAINPDNGPGGSNGPDTDYAPSVAVLNSFANVRVIGYVHTNSGMIAQSEVQTNISNWALWNKYAATAGNSNTTISGIFFDEAPYTDTSKVSYMNSLANYARHYLSRASAPIPYIVYNPGVIELPAYFTSSVDLIIQRETDFADYTPDADIAAFPSGTIPKSAVCLHDTTNSSLIIPYVQRAVRQGLGAIYMTQDPSYNALDPVTVNDVAVGLVRDPYCN